MATATRPTPFTQAVTRWRPVKLDVTAVIVELNTMHRLMSDLDKTFQAFVAASCQHDARNNLERLLDTTRDLQNKIAALRASDYLVSGL